MPSTKANGYKKQIRKIEEEIKNKISEFKSLREGCACYPLLIRQSNIGPRLVDDVYEELTSSSFTCDGGKLIIILDSSGGDIDSAYNLASLLREVGNTYLEFVVPRWAKSAATLLCCAGDKITMTPIAELGPMDPQITTFNPFEK
ncbi:hypothetical protein MYX04_12965, partial [Nitrospiraceae bacterium AH_259_D15_M11_P09]|nr:hypothetical protein [Nitrospiraceae bacterium AH_259_D15_M11_P09]